MKERINSMDNPSESYVKTRADVPRRRGRKKTFIEPWEDYSRRLGKVKVRPSEAGAAFIELVEAKAALKGDKPTEVLAAELVARPEWPPADFAPVSLDELTICWGSRVDIVRQGTLSSLWSLALNKVRRRYCIRQ